MARLGEVYPYEFQALLEALRRDLRAQRIKSTLNLNDADFHRQNVRQVLRLLEVLNPRGSHRASYNAKQYIAYD